MSRRSNVEAKSHRRSNVTQEQLMLRPRSKIPAKLFKEFPGQLRTSGTSAAISAVASACDVICNRGPI